MALASLLARRSCLGRSRTAIFVGEREPDALVRLGLQELEVSALGQCCWVPAPSIGTDPSAGPRPDLLLSARRRRCGRSLELKPWLVTMLRPELEAALPVSEASLGDRQRHILPQRSAAGSATAYSPLQGLTAAATAQVTNPSDVSRGHDSKLPPLFSELRALAHGLASCLLLNL